MTKYRDILRLSSMGLSQRVIVSSCQCSRNTVSEVLNHAKEKEPTNESPSDTQYSDADSSPALSGLDTEEIGAALATVSYFMRSFKKAATVWPDISISAHSSAVIVSDTFLLMPSDERPTQRSSRLCIENSLLNLSYLKFQDQ